jgi:hypothetical protein
MKNSKKIWFRVGAFVIIPTLTLSLLQPGVALAATSSITTDKATSSETSFKKKQTPSQSNQGRGSREAKEAFPTIE